jgi:hypothetical protein
MKPGAVLHRMARVTCTSDRYERVLEPALAGLQHEWNGARSRSTLLRSYAAFWQSWGACILRDASSCESRSFNGAALTALALTLAVAWLMEFALMHASVASQRLMGYVPYIGFYAMFNTATLRWGPVGDGARAVLRGLTDHTSCAGRPSDGDRSWSALHGHLIGLDRSGADSR